MKEENEKLRRKVEELEEKLSGRVEEMEVFLGQKERKVLITGDSHMKAISVERLKSDTAGSIILDQDFRMLPYPMSCRTKLTKRQHIS